MFKNADLRFLFPNSFISPQGVVAFNAFGAASTPTSQGNGVKPEAVDIEVMLVVRVGQQRAPYTIRRGDRIAQMIIHRVYQADVDIVEHLDETDRNTGGFGHTGV